ncbi:MAG TPA: hypothetical protein VND94_10255 [Terriglobia bacterium]|nr:hypothetical protein [Terriglobia bacterium]
MRKLARTALIGVVVIVVLGIGALAICLRQLSDPAGAVSARFTESFVARCIATSQKEDDAQTAGIDSSADSIADLCRCGADNLREDLAETGLGGFTRMIFIEGLDAKLQRVMNACQTTPSAP